MIFHWFSTAWRSLLSNPLFSAITIISLSIGCCGALLAGTNIKQHLSFERFFKDAGRIMIVTRAQSSEMFFSTGPGNAPSTMRQEGPASQARPTTVVSMPIKDAIKDIDGIEMQTRLLYASALFQTDQDELDRRQQAGPLAPGDPPRAPLPGTVFVDEDFFKVFPLTFLEGSAEGLQEPDTIIITKNRAETLFGNEPAVGKIVDGVKGHKLRIIGVVPTQPANTHMVFQTMGGLRTLQMVGQNVTPAFASDWGRTWSGYHYIKMKAGERAETFIPAVATAIKTASDKPLSAAPPGMPPGANFRAPELKWSLVPLVESHLAGPEKITFTFTAAASGDPKLIWTLAGGAIVLLVVSSFNYVTLSLARSLRRRREVAVRKVLGASRGALVAHYLVESGMVTAISLVIGFAAAWFLHPWFARAIGQPEIMFDLLDPVFLGLTLALFSLLALTVGAYPAFYLAAVRPRTGLGEGGTASPGRIGQAVSAGLLGLQIAAAAGLLVISGTMAAQANYIANRNMGFSVKDRYQVSMPCSFFSSGPGPIGPDVINKLMRSCNMGSRDIINRTPGITKSYFFSGALVSENITTQAIGRTSGGEEIGRVSRMGVDLGFLDGVGATLLAGRFFDPNSAFDNAPIERQRTQMAQPMPGPNDPPPVPLTPLKSIPVIITRALLPALGAETPEDAIGKTFAFQPGGVTLNEVVGVIENWHQRPLKFEVTPMVFMPQMGTNAVVELDRSQASAIQKSLQEAWRKQIDNPRANVSVTELQETLDRAYQADFRLMWALISFAAVAIAVAGMGVYGLSAFEMRRRVREIGIRKALGATPAKVAAMVIGRALLFACIATIFAWPIGWWLAEQWLTGFVYRTGLGLAVLPAASAAILVFVAIAVSFNALRAAAIRPGVALRPN